MKGKSVFLGACDIYRKKVNLFKFDRVDKTFWSSGVGSFQRAPGPTLRGQLARRSTAKLCHNQAHMTAALTGHPALTLV